MIGYNRYYLWTWSGAWLLVVDDDPVLPFSIPLSTGGVTPHFPSDSEGSITLTAPSVNPTANWFGSCGCAATTSGYTAWLLQNSKTFSQICIHKICVTQTSYDTSYDVYRYPRFLLNQVLYNSPQKMCSKFKVWRGYSESEQDTPEKVCKYIRCAMKNK